MKKIFIYALLSMLVVSAKAQEVSDQDANQKSKAINQVKLSEQAMYAEVVELASDDFEAVSLAQQKTINKLQNNVIEACAKKINIPPRLSTSTSSQSTTPCPEDQSFRSTWQRSTLHSHLTLTSRSSPETTSSSMRSTPGSLSTSTSSSPRTTQSS